MKNLIIFILNLFKKEEKPVKTAVEKSKDGMSPQISEIEKGRRILDAQIGKPYIFGVEVDLKDASPKAFDCSELVQYFFFQMGRKIPDGSENQYKASSPIEEKQPFDLGFLKRQNGSIHHVVIYYGDNFIVHAKSKETGVIKELANDWARRNGPEFAGWRRFNGMAERKV